MLAAFRAALAAATDPGAIEEVRRTHTGKKSPLKEALKALRDVPPEERPAVAKAINDAGDTIEAELDARAAKIEALALDRRLAAEWIDLTMPGVPPIRRGGQHPVTEVERGVLDVLRQLGFSGGRRCRSRSRAPAACTATKPSTRRTSRCSTSSKACGSTRGSRSRT
jgi:phenylalanyl-tRNA synthetase alpha chain